MWSRRPRVRVPSLTPLKSLHSGRFRHFWRRAVTAPRGQRGDNFFVPIGGEFCELCGYSGHRETKRANGAGAVYIKHGSYYGRWLTPPAGANRARAGATAGILGWADADQAEKRLRELMAEDAVPS